MGMWAGFTRYADPKLGRDPVDEAEAADRTARLRMWLLVLASFPLPLLVPVPVYLGIQRSRGNRQPWGFVAAGCALVLAAMGVRAAMALF